MSGAVEGSSAAEEVESVTQLLRENELISDELNAYKQLCRAMSERHTHAIQCIKALRAVVEKLSRKWDHSEVQTVRGADSAFDTRIEICDKQIELIRQQLFAGNCVQKSTANSCATNKMASHQQNSQQLNAKHMTSHPQPHHQTITATKRSITHWNNSANSHHKYRCEYFGCNQLFSRKDQMESHVRIHNSMQEAITCGQILSVVPTNSTSPTSSPTIDVTTFDRLKDNCAVGKVSEVIFVPQVEFEVIDYHNNSSNNSANDSSISFNHSNNNDDNHGHSRPEKALIGCDLCGKQFSKHYIQSHRRSHTGIKPYKCSFAGCERTFTQTSSRNFHEKTYHRCDKYSMFRCYYRSCDKSFSRQIDLQKHLSQHNHSVVSGNSCAQESVRVVKTRQLRRVSHRAGKHECTHCGKTFAHKVALRQHEVVHGSKQFVCHIASCDYASFWKQNLSLHLRRHHNHE